MGMHAHITVVTSNIRFDNPADGSHSWQHRRENLAQLILSQDPHIIGTQEGREPQLRELASLLPGYRILETNRHWIDERMYPTLFVKEAHVLPIDSGDVWLSETPHISGSSSFDSAFPRLFTWSKVRIGSEKWLVVNVHLDHVKSSTRLSQIAVLANEVARLRTNERLIILGDFNDSPQSQVQLQLLQAFPELIDPWPHPEESSHHPFTGENTEGSRIDWILLDQRHREAKIEMLKQSMNGTWPSDHFPIVCRFRP